MSSISLSDNVGTETESPVKSASRGGFASNIGFILAAAGSAVGLGNIWKFPYITGVYGGGAFVLVYLGCILLAGVYLAIGMLFSALTQNQVVAFILGTAASVVFLIIGLPETLQGIGGLFGGYVEQVMASLSMADHFDTMTRGLLEVGSVVFFLAFTAGWLLCGMVALDRTKAA